MERKSLFIFLQENESFPFLPLEKKTIHACFCRREEKDEGFFFSSFFVENGLA